MMKRILATLLASVLTLSMLPMTAMGIGRGDFDNNARIDTNDVRALMTAIAKNQEVSLTKTLWGDLDMDMKLSTSDARKLLSAVMVDGIEPDSNYALPTGEDYWGENSIALLGDSISWGSGTSGGISEYSYVSYVKRAVQNYNGGKMNYGFVSAYPKQWKNGNLYTDSEELHGWPERSEKVKDTPDWTDNGDGERLMKVAMVSTIPWATITYKLRNNYHKNYNYFCVYYDAVSDGAGFCIANGTGGEVEDVNGNGNYIQTKSSTRITKRTEFFPLADCPKDSNGVPKIIICHDGTTNPVAITGIAYYKTLPKANNADGYVTFNSFVRGGAMLSELSYQVLEQAASADTLIMSLGYNDLAWAYGEGYTRDDFINRINFLIEKCNENGTQVIVNDFIWNNYQSVSPYLTWGAASRAEVDARSVLFSDALRRLADETNGIYVDHEAILGSDTIIPNLPDGVHPNNAGHKMIAQNVVAALGLSDYFTEAWK